MKITGTQSYKGTVVRLTLRGDAEIEVDGKKHWLNRTNERSVPNSDYKEIVYGWEPLSKNPISELVGGINVDNKLIKGWSESWGTSYDWDKTREDMTRVVVLAPGHYTVWASLLDADGNVSAPTSIQRDRFLTATTEEKVTLTDRIFHAKLGIQNIRFITERWVIVDAPIEKGDVPTHRRGYRAVSVNNPYLHKVLPTIDGHQIGEIVYTSIRRELPGLAPVDVYFTARVLGAVQYGEKKVLIVEYVDPIRPDWAQLEKKYRTNPFLAETSPEEVLPIITTPEGKTFTRGDRIFILDHGTTIDPKQLNERDAALVEVVTRSGLTYSMPSKPGEWLLRTVLFNDNKHVVIKCSELMKQIHHGLP